MQHFIGPNKTPPVIRWMIWIIAIASLLYPLFTYFMLDTFKTAAPGFWFPLSLIGMKQGYVWQLLTYFFVHSIGTSFSIFFLLSLFFHLFLFWFGGCEIANRYGTLKFLLFYLGGGVFAALVALLYFWLFNAHGVLVGSGPPVFALITVWGMLFPNLTLYMFFALRVAAKWIVLLLLAFSLVFNLFAGEFSAFVGDLSGIIWGFCIGRYFLHLPNPYWGRHIR